MNDFVGPWVRRFLMEYVIGERNCSPTRSTAIAIPSGCCCPGGQAMPMHSGVPALERIKPKLLREFTRHLEQVVIAARRPSTSGWPPSARGPICGDPKPGTLGMEHPGSNHSSQEMHVDSSKLLEKAEMQALLNQPDRQASKAFAITPCSYFCTTQAHAPVKSRG